MIKDLDRDIVTIKYNILNLPDTVQFKNGYQIVNRYDASGKKLGDEYYTILYSVQVPIAAGQVLNIKNIYGPDEVDLIKKYYVDNFTYNWHIMSLSPGRCDLEKVYNAEGYVDNIGFDSHYYNYFRKDHLGSNREVWRASYRANNKIYPAETIQRTQYYPSGLPWAEGAGAALQNRKYNGKEWIEAHGYDMYDYGARGYYPAIMRFTTVDPLCEKYPEISPYVYCHNNPVNMVDPEGLTDYSVNKEGYIYKTNPILDGVRKLFGIKDKDDKLIAVDNKNNTLVMPAGSIGEVKSCTDDKGKKVGDYFNVSNDKVAGKAYEFLSENTGVEFTRIEYNNSKESDNIISTSHQKGSDATGPLISDKLSSDGYNVSRLTHSHPEGGMPSGYVPGHQNSGDKNFTNYMNLKYPNNTTVYRVYDVPNRRYIYYNNANVYKYENKKKK